MKTSQLFSFMIAFSAATILISCSSDGKTISNSSSKIVIDKKVEVETLPLGVSYIEPKSDVATLAFGKRHVLGPDNIQLSEQTVTRPIKATPSRNNMDKISGDTDIAAMKAKSPTDLAWDKLCRGENLSAEEHRLIDDSSMPTNWEQHCNPIK